MKIKTRIALALLAGSTVLISCNFKNIFSKETTTNMNATEITTTPFYGFKMNDIEGKSVDFAQFKGKKVLIVNTASACGYTPQYRELQELHLKYKDKLVVVGFPCNDFGNQESGTATEIQSFCQKNYGVTFLMMEKITVKGDAKPALYSWLTDKSQNGWNDKAPGWNFCKYLVDEKGILVNFFASAVKPMDKELTDAVVK